MWLQIPPYLINLFALWTLAGVISACTSAVILFQPNLEEVYDFATPQAEALFKTVVIMVAFLSGPLFFVLGLTFVDPEQNHD